MSNQWVDTWLGSPRFQRYVDTCSGDRSRALKLYEWNVALGHALLRDISHFEIALRNAYDTAFGSQWHGRVHWLLDPDSPVVTPIWRVKKDDSGFKRGTDVNYLNRRSVDTAIRKFGGSTATPGKVIAELSFGFWSHLTASPQEKTIWVPYLHHAFPHGTVRSHVNRVIQDLNTVRNRIAHHEPMFDRFRAPDQEPSVVSASLLQVLKMIAPNVETHVAATSTVDAVLITRP